MTLHDARTVAIIPARYEARRFPGKALADLGGRPVIAWVYERASQAKRVDAVVVATDDNRIAEAVAAFGGLVEMTREDHHSGTERIAEVAAKLPAAEVILNVQGDEPFVEPAAIDILCEPLLVESGPGFTTLRERVLDERDLDDPNVVKVVTDAGGHALYFSRARIPSGRGPTEAVAYRHVGLYGFRREQLLWFASLPPSPLEGAEGLEQLRILEHGERIAVLDAQGHSLSIDTPADLDRACAWLEASR